MAARKSRRLWIVILAVVVVGVAARVWHKQIRPQVIPKNFGVVEAGQIYRSGQLTPRMLKKVKREHHIRTIVDLAGAEPGRVESAREQEVADELGVQRYTFAMSGDGRGDPAEVAEALRLIADPENQPVLVHCAAGAQRTSTLVILYRHLVQGRPIAEVYPESFDYRHEPDEWPLLAFLADHVDEIRANFEAAPDVAAAGQ